MKHKELTFTEIKRVYPPGKHVVAAHVYFSDAGGQRYALILGITEILWNGWNLGERTDDAVEKIVFQAADEYIDEMIWKGELQKMIPKNNILHEKVYSTNDKDPDQCPYDLDQPLPVFPFPRVFWPRQGGNPVELRQEERIQFLLRLYELCAGNIGPSYNSKEIARELNIDLDNVRSICVFLSKEGFINLTMDGSVSIIHEGIKKAEEYEANLRQLQSHGLRRTSLTQASPPSKGSSVFISYSHKDKQFARKLGEMLERGGAKVWIDEIEMQIGDSLVTKIPNAIKDNDYLIAVLSPNSIGSNWVQKELKLAMNHEIEGKHIKVLPVLLEQCIIPEFLKDKYYADFTSPEKFKESYNKLLKALNIDGKEAEIRNPEPRVSSSQIGDHIETETERLPIAQRDSLENYVDIKIKELDRKRTRKPDSKKDLYNVYLELSECPSQTWVEIFEAERKFPRHLMWRRAWIEDKYVVIQCVVEELSKYHLSDLKEDVANTNQKYRDYLRENAIRATREDEKNIQERKRLDEAFNGLTFN